MEPIYVVHPLTAEQKKSLLGKGKIIDARFAPDGVDIVDLKEVENQPEPKKKTGRAKKKPIDLDKYSDDQIWHYLLDQHGLELPKDTPRDTLVAKYNELDANK